MNAHAAGGLADLAEAAARRAARFRILGRLVVAEPREEESALAASMPSLAARFADPAGLRADYHDVFVSAVPCYESVFTSPDGQLGTVAGSLTVLYRRFDIDWRHHRVAAPDHLGVQLLAYASLCELEAEAWADDRPDRAGTVVDAQRELLAAHLGAWAPAALEALARAAAGSAYAEVAALCDEVLGAEAARLRPAAEHPGMAPGTPPSGDQPPFGAGRITRALLAPARAGGYLLAPDVGPLAAEVGAPWRASDTRARLRHVIETAIERNAMPAVTRAFVPLVGAWAERWRATRDALPGAWRTYETWRVRAEGTLAWLERLGEDSETLEPPVLVVPTPTRLAEALAALSAGGFAVATTPAPAHVRDTVDVLVRLEPAGTEQWVGTPPEHAVAKLPGSGESPRGGRPTGGRN